ncbi:MAG: DEAD/DEAH box helicase [Caldilineales bacterium]|nr:DEAD/DEAH box helicase [Caldilineales bacterium]
MNRIHITDITPRLAAETDATAVLNAIEGVDAPQLDFSDLTILDTIAALALMRGLAARFGPDQLMTLIAWDSVPAASNLALVTAIQQAMTLPSPRPAPSPPRTDSPSPASFNPFSALTEIQDQYRRYVHTFQTVSNPAIRDWMAERVARGTLLWRDPTVQLRRFFQPGLSFNELESMGLHRATQACFTVKRGDRSARPISPYQHQSEAIVSILGLGANPGEGRNTIVATGTGSGKSFCFGIPIVSECLRLKSQGVLGIKAVIIYPVNALANSQYADFAQRLSGSGLKLALYTGDTEFDSEKALQQHRQTYGREPFDSEVISRHAIQGSDGLSNMPDILMTNYVQLELLLTRFEDKKLFGQPGVLRFLVLDEVHTYSGKRGADVACLIRRLKQHTGAIGKLCCIGTSATVQSEAGDGDERRIIADFAQKLFGEPVRPEHVITESYLGPRSQPDQLLALPAEVLVSETMLDAYDGRLETVLPLVEALLGRALNEREATPTGLGELLLRQPTLTFIERALADGSEDYHALVERYQRQFRSDADHAACAREIQAAFLAGISARVPAPGREDPVPWFVPKVHAFFSQGRSITACLFLKDNRPAHLNDRGDQVCMDCAHEGRVDVPTYPLYFCRSCGQEFFSVAVQDDGRLLALELNAEHEGKAAYLYPAHFDTAQTPLPDNWLTPTGNIRQNYRESVPRNHTFCPRCNRLDTDCQHAERIDVALVSAPFLLCPACGIVHDRRPSEFNKLFTYGSVGRSTATDILISNTLRRLPSAERKLIAFSDNRQDTALQAAHINSLQRRIAFRRILYNSLVEAGRPLDLDDIGSRLFDTQQNNNLLPDYRKDETAYVQDTAADERYQRYLRFLTLQELEGTHRRLHQNLEDVGLMQVGYKGLAEFAADNAAWQGVPVLADADVDTRYDYLLGLLDIMRKRLAIADSAALRPPQFRADVLNKLNEAAFIHSNELITTGFTDEITAAEANRFTNTHRFVSSNSAAISWTRRALGLSYQEASELLPELIALCTERSRHLVKERVNVGTRRRPNYVELYMVNPAYITLSADSNEYHLACRKCHTVHPFRRLLVCTTTSCSTLQKIDLSANYFRAEYSRSLSRSVTILADEHSGQVPGVDRKQMEQRFESPDDPLNVLVCTPTMELGINIGDLSAVYMRNVPPSPSNYAQRAGRAGREGQAALITVFCGVGFARGPHDQYFYRQPEKIISGKIVAPRFLLDNQALLRSHIHALMLETLGREHKLHGAAKLLIDIDQPNLDYPLLPDWRDQWERALLARHAANINAVTEAFADEIRAFAWFDASYVTGTVNGFMNAFDRAFDRWRREYRQLSDELEYINRQQQTARPDPSLDQRRSVIERKLNEMREGEGEYYILRYLGSQGFLPNYAFPRQATVLSFYDRIDDLARNPAIALREYAPGNFIYYRGTRYEVERAQAPTRGGELDVGTISLCPACQQIYHREPPPVCRCGHDLSAPVRLSLLSLPDAFARRNANITADEEERMRKGYEISYHYTPNQVEAHAIMVGEKTELITNYDHNAMITAINRGVRDPDGAQGFSICPRCFQWLMTDKAVEEHGWTTQKEGNCPQHVTSDELGRYRHIRLYIDIRSDALTIEAPLPEDASVEPDAFYTTLLHSFRQAIALALSLDDNELDGFLAPIAGDSIRKLLVLHEIEDGGAGALASLRETSRWRMVIGKALELLHEGEEGCEKACYECLCSFYNQLDHPRLDRRLALPLLRRLNQAEVLPQTSPDLDHFQTLVERCQSNLEKQVLYAIRDAGIPLPEEAQKLIIHEGVPIASADFYYSRTIVFVDGSPHYQDWVRLDDAGKRQRLRALGLRVIVIQGEDINSGLMELKERLGNDY